MTKKELIEGIVTNPSRKRTIPARLLAEIVGCSVSHVHHILKDLRRQELISDEEINLIHEEGNTSLGY